MADDHGYGDCGFTGHPFVQTPNLDLMAKSGVVFNRFYASACLFSNQGQYDDWQASFPDQRSKPWTLYAS